MTTEETRTFPCDLCGADDPAEIAIARHYTNGQPLHVCRSCGFVYVRERRSARAIANTWTEELYKTSYTARIPAVKARQVFVGEMIDATLGLRGNRLCDIGGGEGQFLEIARGPDYGADVFAIEPSPINGRALSDLGVKHFQGTIEEFAASGQACESFDIVTIMWTLENCQDCRAMLDAAYALLKANGHVVVATGSRILVPFKKPLQLYLSTNPADTHCFRFSANTLRGILAECGLEVAHTNRHIDHDVLCMIARKTDRSRPISWQKDDYREVIDFFQRWHRETQDHYAVVEDRSGRAG